MPSAKKRKRSSSTGTSSRPTRKHRKPPPEIVLYISAHGEQLEQSLPSFTGLHVEMLSFAHVYGDMGTMLVEPFEDISDTLDEVAMRQTLKDLRNRPKDIRTCLRNQIQPHLHGLYATAFEDDDAELKKFLSGFAIVRPTRDKRLYFTPNPGESTDYDPHYGLHILDVAHLTPALRPLGAFKSRHHPKYSYDYGNITDQKRLLRSTVDIDRNIRTMIHAIRALPDSTREKAAQIYRDMLREFHDPPDSPKSTANLSDIYFLFHALGFRRIYLIDPTCRAWSHENAKMATLRQRTDPVVGPPPARPQKVYMTPDADASLTPSQMGYKPYVAPEEKKPTWGVGAFLRSLISY